VTLPPPQNWSEIRVQGIWAEAPGNFCVALARQRIFPTWHTCLNAQRQGIPPQPGLFFRQGEALRFFYSPRNWVLSEDGLLLGISRGYYDEGGEFRPETGWRDCSVSLYEIASCRRVAHHAASSGADYLTFEGHTLWFHEDEESERRSLTPESPPAPAPPAVLEPPGEPLPYARYGVWADGKLTVITSDETPSVPPLSSDGKKSVVYRDSSLFLLNGPNEFSLPDAGLIPTLVFSHDGEHLLVGGGKGSDGVLLHCLKTHSGELLWSVEVPGCGSDWLHGAVWSEDDQQVFVGRRRDVLSLSARDGSPVVLYRTSTDYIELLPCRDAPGWLLLDLNGLYLLVRP
jgi:hypothetical protein